MNDEPSDDKPIPITLTEAFIDFVRLQMVLNERTTNSLERIVNALEGIERRTSTRDRS